MFVVFILFIYKIATFALMIDYTIKEIEKTVLIGIITQYQNEEKIKEYLDELDFLALTAGAETVKRFTQKLQRPHPKTFVGTGKLEEIAQYLEANPDIGLVIFDDELSPSQLRNIEPI